MVWLRFAFSTDLKSVVTTDIVTGKFHANQQPMVLLEQGAAVSLFQF